MTKLLIYVHPLARKFSSIRWCAKYFEFHNCRTYSWVAPDGDGTDFSIYNSLTKTVVPFVTKKKELISWYACGPTVHDSAHVGHACSYIRLDIIRRILEKYTSKKIVQVMCVTDIDDKIIRRANSLNMNWKSLACAYEEEFFEDLRTLNVSKPSFICRASDYVPQMIKFVQCLLDKNLAYKTADGSVYFSLKNYGKHGKLKPLSQQPIGSLERDENILASKELSADFALWKGAKLGEPFWQTPWGLGRPGWHLECSVIASEYFGNNVDIHSGGADLLFPHHENEESQCCAFHDVDRWVNYWIHTGLVRMNNNKMSKSLGNGLNIRDYLSANSSNYLRMLCLSTNYRDDVDINSEEMTMSFKLCSKFFDFFDECWAYLNGYTDRGDVDDVKLVRILEKSKIDIDQYLKDDFDTMSCINRLVFLVTETRLMLQAERGRQNQILIHLVNEFVQDKLKMFGFNIVTKNVSEFSTNEFAKNVDDIVDSCVAFRSEVRNESLTMVKSTNQDVKNAGEKLLKMCDGFRKNMFEHEVAIKDRKNDVSTWTRLKPFKKNIEPSS